MAVLELGVDVSICVDAQNILQPFQDSIAQSLNGELCSSSVNLSHIRWLTPFSLKPRHHLGQIHKPFIIFLSNLWLDLPRPVHGEPRDTEHCQTMAQRHKVSCISWDVVAGAHAGEPIAFIMANSSFSLKMTLWSPLSKLIQNQSMWYSFTYIFCFNKSSINGCWHKFYKIMHTYLCPVLAGLLIIQWVQSCSKCCPTTPSGCTWWHQQKTHLAFHLLYPVKRGNHHHAWTGGHCTSRSKPLFTATGMH